MSSRRSRSTPTEFTLQDLQTSVPDDIPLQLGNKIQDIVAKLRQRIDGDDLKDILKNGTLLTSAHDQKGQAPEEFTKNVIIEQLFEELNFPYAHQEVNTPAEDEDQWVDYSVPLDDYPNIDSTQLLIEAEPINKRLDQQKHGIGQVKGWLHHEPFESDFGMVTDGLRWILLKKDPDTHTINKISSIDLTPVFIALFEDQATNKSDAEDVLSEEHLQTLEEFYRTFYFDNFTNIASGVQSIIRRKKKEITESFYDGYIEIVFGITDEDSDGRDTDRCLVADGLDSPASAGEEERRLFSVQLMNRLVFIKFLEDTGVVDDALLNEVKQAHEDGEHLGDFYSTFIQPLVYDVFNKPKGKRPDKIQERSTYRDIPYLNGGLFRANIEDEEKFTVSDAVLLNIIDLLEDYEFSTTGGPDELDPSVLGTVFEKTINYLAGETGAQKDLGAYYTPDNITRYTADRSVKEGLLTEFKQTLQQDWGWREGEIARYDDIHELVDALSPNEDQIDSLIATVDDFRVLDPACGSGHFLTSVLNEIVAIRRSLYEKHSDSPANHTLKKRTVLANLYGVDIVGPGVEITKLRLWLSIMADLSETDLDDLDPGELALPNVAFNIREGNSLIGYTDTQRLQIEDENDEHQQSPLSEWTEKSVEELVEERQELVNEYKQLYGEDAHDIEDEIQELDTEYNSTLNEKLLDDLRNADVSFEHEMDTVEAPDLPGKAIEKISIEFEDALSDSRKEELDDEFRDAKGLRINKGKDGYVSMTLSNKYVIRTPEGRLQQILDRVEGNIEEFEIFRYLTEEDLEDVEYLHWPLEFYEVFQDGGFDVAIGNPPYGIDISEAESALGNYPDENHSSMVFASRSEHLTRSGGQVSFVVPKALTYAYRWADARNHLLETDLDYLIDLREAFDGVKQEQIILMFSSTDVDDDIVVGRRNDNGSNTEFFEQGYQQSAFDEDGFYMWVDEENEDILKKLSEYDTFDDVEFAEATKGIDAFKSYLTGDPSDLLAYRGDDIGQFRFVSESYLDSDIKKRSNFHLAGKGKEKVVFQRILAHITDPTDRIVIQCAVDYDGATIPDTSIHAIPKNHSVELLCGLMNSSLFAWYAYTRIYNRAIRSMDLTPIYFGRLPAPPQDDEHLIETIEECTKQIQSCGPSDRQQILDAYSELNDAVYDLYKLNDEERQVLESNTPPHEGTLLNW
ncbi:MULTISPECIES: Eco57I restriction-modification methylase domain-containing protein [Haloarcula]|uniref:Eco57I restriction-modification methylase domain-containing protein n=1 Tax=Haloarcula TaxID=2237 RepID=UPI0023EB2EC9|nr:DNA methyltransferase [Halomicroarcula sp. XH51]